MTQIKEEKYQLMEAGPENDTDNITSREGL